MTSYDNTIKEELKEMFNDGILMTNRQVAAYLGVTESAVRHAYLKENIEPIFSLEKGKTMIRIFYYPDVTLFKKYREEKKKMDTYESYHKKIHTAKRKRIKKLLEENIWSSDQTSEFLGITSRTLDGLVKRHQLKLFEVYDVSNTRLFFVPDVKEFKIQYDAYLNFLKKNKKS